MYMYYVEPQRGVGLLLLLFPKEDERTLNSRNRITELLYEILSYIYL